MKKDKKPYVMIKSFLQDSIIKYQGLMNEPLVDYEHISHRLMDVLLELDRRFKARGRY